MIKPPPDPYAVGYGRPPKANQFRRGQSGNPRGRKRGDENILAVFKRYVQKQVQIKSGDVTRTVTLAEAVILKNCNEALRRNSLAMNNIFNLAKNSGELIDASDAKQVGAPIAVPERPKSMEEFMAMYGRTVETE